MTETLEEMLLKIRRLGYPDVGFFGLGGGFGGVDCRVRGGEQEEFVVNRPTDREALPAALTYLQAREAAESAREHGR